MSVDKGGIFLIKATYRELGDLYFSVLKDLSVEDIYRHIGQNERIEEAVVLWTCNRLEVYFYPGDMETVEYLEEYISNRAGKNMVIHGWDAVRHLFRVAAGLESMLVGENEILGQVKDAWEYSRKLGYSRRNMNLVFRKAVEIGKKVRRDIPNGFARRSIAGYAIDQLSPANDNSVILIGAGDLGRQFGAVLSRKGIHFSVSNRTRSRAEELAGRYGADVEDFDPRRWVSYDIIITATRSPRYLLFPEDLDSGNVKGIIDLATPPNVAPAVGERVRLVNMHSVSAFISEADREKREYMERGSAIVEREFNAFSRNVTQTEKSDLLRKIYEYSEAVIGDEIRILSRKLSRSDEELSSIMKGLDSVRNKLLGFVINGIKRAEDIKSSEVIDNMGMILDEELSRFKAQETEEVRGNKKTPARNNYRQE